MFDINIRDLFMLLIPLQEGAELLAASGGVVDGTRSETKKVEEAMKANEEENQSANGTSNDENDGEGALKRKGTMQLTAEVMLFLLLLLRTVGLLIPHHGSDFIDYLLLHTGFCCICKHTWPHVFVIWDSCMLFCNRYSSV